MNIVLGRVSCSFQQSQQKRRALQSIYAVSQCSFSNFLDQQVISESNIFLLCQAGFLSHFSYATLVRVDGFSRVPQADFLDCHGTMYAQSYHAPLSLL